MKQNIKWHSVKFENISAEHEIGQGDTIPGFNHPLQNFNLSIMETNFKLSTAMCIILDDIDGVEATSLITPYRILIGFGKLFNENSVKNSIELKLTGSICGNTQLSIEDLPIKLAEQAHNKLGTSSSLLVFPNGRICESKDSDHDILEETANFVGGVILRSTDG